MIKSRFFWGIGVIALLVVVGLFSACSSEPSQKIALVSNARVSAETELGKQLADYSRAVVANLEAQMAAIRERHKGNDENSRRVLQQAENELQAHMHKLRQDVSGAFVQNYQKAMDDYRRNNKVDLILPLESVSSSNQAMDATNEIIRIMNSYPLPKEFEIPAQQPAPAQQQAPAAPATQQDKPAQ